MHVIFICQLNLNDAEELIKKNGVMPMMSFLSKKDKLSYFSYGKSSWNLLI